MTFHDYFVSDSLCCPSRASIFTGNFPHDTHVLGNTGRHGGLPRLLRPRRGAAHLRDRAQARRLPHRADGQVPQRLPRDAAAPPRRHRRRRPAELRPAGLGELGRRRATATPSSTTCSTPTASSSSTATSPSDYLTDVLARDGADFINRSARAGKPFFLELATFAPHSPYVPAPRNAQDFPGLRAPEPPSFNMLPTHPPTWLSKRPPLTALQIDRINRVFRRRAQAVAAVDAMIGRIERDARC